jgi:DNA-directed RNA polymerase subunit beta'
VGPLHPADHHRSGGKSAFEDLVDGHLGPRGNRRSDRHRQARDQRLARCPRGATCVRPSSSWTPAAPTQAGLDRRRSPLPAAGRRDPLGRTRRRVKPGDVIARIPTEGAKTRDITGGLPRVAELFEARRPKDCAVIAEMDGRVEFGKDYKNKRRIKITPEETLQPMEYLIPKGKHISVQEGDFVQKGDYIIDGNPDPHDILRIKGVEALAELPRRTKSRTSIACRA